MASESGYSPATDPQSLRGMELPSVARRLEAAVLSESCVEPLCRLELRSSGCWGGGPPFAVAAGSPAPGSLRRGGGGGGGARG